MQKNDPVNIIWQVKIIKTGKIVLKFNSSNMVIFRDTGLDTMSEDILNNK